MSYSDGRSKTIVEELEEASEELEELSKFNAKKKGRESYKEAVKDVANWLIPKTREVMSDDENDNDLSDSALDVDAKDSKESDLQRSPSDERLSEFIESIRLVNEGQQSSLPRPTKPISTQTSLVDFFINHQGNLPSSISQESGFSNDVPTDEELPDDFLNENSSQEFFPKVFDQRSRQLAMNLRNMNRNIPFGDGHFPMRNDREIPLFQRHPRQIASKSMSEKLQAQEHFQDEYQYLGISNSSSQHEYRDMDMNVFTGRDRVSKYPNPNYGPAPVELEIVKERHSYPTVTSKRPSPSEKMQHSPSPLTSILTGKDGKLMTGPRAVARLTEHQQTSSKLFNRNRNENGPPHRHPHKTQLAIQNLQPTSNSIMGNASYSNVVSQTVDFYDSVPNLSIAPKSNVEVSSKPSGSGRNPYPNVSLETFTVGLGKRPSIPQKHKTSSMDPNCIETQTGNNADKKPTSNRKLSIPKETVTNNSSSFGIERRHSLGSTKSGSGRKKDEKKLKSPKLKSNGFIKTEPETINVFENEKFNSLLMKMMSEAVPADSDQNGPSKKILTKKLKMPNSAKANT